MEKVIIVDENDRPLGLEEKFKCHSGNGILHRAFSVFVFNKDGRILLQQRSNKKLLWPLYWSNTCCSHPLEGETYEQAASRRLWTEMGFSCNLKLVGTFHYQASYKDKGSENELCAVLIGIYDGKVHADGEEVADWKWLDFRKLKRDVAAYPEKYTPWLKTEIEQFANEFDFMGRGSIHAPE
jgi:isopentenyl-diphosphate delta-isomerase